MIAGYLSELSDRLTARLGDRLLGAWVIGSGALGDFDAQRSDIDVQAVSAERLPPAELEALAAELSHEALPCRAGIRRALAVQGRRGELGDDTSRRPPRSSPTRFAAEPTRLRPAPRPPRPPGSSTPLRERDVSPARVVSRALHRSSESDFAQSTARRFGRPGLTEGFLSSDQKGHL